MKKQLYYLKILSLFGVLFMLTSCVTEESVTVPESRGEINSRFVSIDEIKEMPGVMERLGSLTISNANSRIAHSNKYSFSVDTDQVLLIEDGKYKSLSFPIKRDIDNGLVENLFLHPYKDGYLAFLFKYRLTSVDITNIQLGKPVNDLLNKLSFTPLTNPDIDGLGVQYANTTYGNDVGNSDHSWYAGGKCWVWHNLHTDGQDDWVPQECPGCECPRPSSGVATPIFQQYFVIVNVRNGGGSGTAPSPFYPAYGGGGTTNPGGTGTGTCTNPTNPPTTNPNGPQQPGLSAGDGDPIIGVVLSNPNRAQRNCEALQNFTNNLKVKNSLNDLKSKTHLGIENGYSYSDNSDPAPVPLANGSPNMLDIPTGGSRYGGSHTHPDPSSTEFMPMFSLSDIFKLGQLARNYDSGGLVKDYSKFVFTLTVNKNGIDYTFAIKIENINDFNGFIDAFYNMTPDQRREMSRGLAREYSKLVVSMV